jgi:S1-C subfamily serine protease
LLVGDIIVSIDGQTITDADQLLASLVGDVVGKPVPVQVLRGGQATVIQVTIGERKD